MPADSGPRPSGAPRAATTRLTGAAQLELVPLPATPRRRTSSTRSRSPFCRMTSTKGRPSATPLSTPNIARAAGLRRRSRPRSSSATTPSVIPSRIVRTFACSSPRRSIFSRSARAVRLSATPSAAISSVPATGTACVRSPSAIRRAAFSIPRRGRVTRRLTKSPMTTATQMARMAPPATVRRTSAWASSASCVGTASRRTARRRPSRSDRHRDVQEVSSDGRAPADVAADLARQRPAHLRAAGVILDLADGLPVGFGQDDAVGADDGHPRPEDPRVALGTALEAGPTGRAVEQGQECVVEEPRVGDERPLEPRDGLRLEGAAHVDPHDENAQAGDDSEEDGESRGETEAAPRRPVRRHVSPSNR